MNHPFPSPPHDSRQLLHELSRPLPRDSIRFHLFRLEGLFQALHELWGTPARHFAVHGHRLRAVTGAECPGQGSGGSLRPALALGGRICNGVLRQLEQEGTGADRSDAAAQIRELLGLLIALEDLVGTTPTAPHQRPQYEQAARELARLLGRTDGAGIDLVQAGLATARSLAAEVLAGLYLRPCP